MRPKPWGVATRGRRSSFVDAEAGMTLVELMLAMVLLGVILSATAMSLITFSRTSVNNEARVQATAYLNELHESLQTIPWDRAALYSDEIAPLDAIGANSSATPPLLGPDELVVIDPPDYSGCSTDEPKCERAPFVPLVFFDTTIDGRTYDVLQAVSWVDRRGDGVGDVKRFTTVVSWELLGTTYEQRFESERAPTASEVEVVVPPAVVDFTVTPTQAAIDANGLLIDDLSIFARFDRGITAAEVNYESYETDPITGDQELVERTLPLTPTSFESAKPIVFVGTIAAGGRSFPDGSTAFELVGFDALVPVTATTSVDFLPPGATPPAPPPSISSILPLKNAVNVGSSGTNTGELRCALTVEVRVNGLDPAGTVTLSYTALTSEGLSMTPPGTITGSNDRFAYTFQNGSTSLWQPAGSPINELFTAVARNPDGRSSTAAISSQVTFTSANGTC